MGWYRNRDHEVQKIVLETGGGETFKNKKKKHVSEQK
jgi:hypothetical protein